MSAQSKHRRGETARDILKKFGVAIDGRSREAVAMLQLYRQLARYVGKPTVVQEALIASLCRLRMRLLRLDQAFVDSGAIPEADARAYSHWLAAYHKGLGELGLAKGEGFDPYKHIAKVTRRGS